MKKIWSSPAIVAVEVNITSGGKEGNTSEISLYSNYSQYIDENGKWRGNINNGTGQGNNSAANAYNAWIAAKS